MADTRKVTKKELIDQLEGKKTPQHIAIIMDGNGRWALSRNRKRVDGHRAGVKSVDEVTESCAKMGVKRLTLYAFSSENWRRPPEEVTALMDMLRQYLITKRGKIMRNKIRLTSIGNVTMLPLYVKSELDKTIDMSRDNDRMTLCLALNYGGQQEIAEAVQKAIRNGATKQQSVDRRLLKRYMYDPEMMEPDLLIRTGGEIRISNFLLWHISYTELYFTKTLWPDFRTSDLIKSIKEFSRRKRRYGGLDDYQA